MNANQKRSQSLKGIKRSPETRAAMYASRLVHQVENAEEWERLYTARLAELQNAEKIRGLTPI